MKLTGPALIADQGTLQTVCEILLSIITKTHPCQKDFGDEEELGLLEETSEFDWHAIDSALDVVIAVAVVLGGTFAELWKMYEKPILKFVSGSDPKERSTSVGVIAECIKAMGNSVTPFTTILLKPLLHRMSDEDPETKSNAAYAIGLLQQNSTNDQEILKSFPVILGKLEPLLNTDEARCKDNAAGCVSRMIMRHPAKTPTAQILPALLDILPLRDDYDENEPVYDMMIKLCKSFKPTRVQVPANGGPDSEQDKTIMSLTPRILPILAEVTAPEPKDQLKDETREKIAHLVKFLAGKYPQEVRKYEGLAALM